MHIRLLSLLAALPTAARTAARPRRAIMVPAAHKTAPTARPKGTVIPLR